MVEADPKPSSIQAALRRILGEGGDTVDLRARLIRGTAGVFLLQLVAVGLGFLTNILLARFLGAAQFGVYSYVFAWVSVLTVFSMFGFGGLLVREIAATMTAGEFGVTKGVIRWVGTRSLLISVVVAGLFALATVPLLSYFDPLMFPALWVALLAVPLLTLIMLSEQATQGFGRAILSRVPQVLVRVPLFLLLLVAGWLLVPNDLDAVVAVSLSLVALLVTLLAAVVLLWKAIPGQVARTPGQVKQRDWWRSAVPLLMVAVLFELNARLPAIMLGSLAGARETGIFTVAVLVASLISFILTSANAVLGPIISGLNTSGDMRRLQRIMTKSARVTLAIAMGIALLIVIFRRQLLALFGLEFLASGNALVILSAGQLINVAAGSVALLLVMTGRERTVVKANAIAAVVTVLLLAGLVPAWGIAGAAVATAVSTAIWNLILVARVRSELGIDPTALGRSGAWE